MDGIFISYRRDDAAGYAGRLYDRLAGHFGAARVFMDVEGIEPGTDFVEAIEAAVASCRAMIVIIGNDWATMRDGDGRSRLEDPHDFIRIEAGFALRRNIRVVPVLVEGATMPRLEQLPDDLKPLVRRQAIEISHKQWEASTGELIKTLERLLGAEPVPDHALPVAPRPPPAAPASERPVAAAPPTRPTPPPSPAASPAADDRPSASRQRWLVLAALVLAVGGGLAFWLRPPATGEPAPTAKTAGPGETAQPVTRAAPPATPSAAPPATPIAAPPPTPLAAVPTPAVKTPAKPAAPPRVDSLSAEVAGNKATLCYRVANATSTELSPHPGALANPVRGCVVVALAGASTFTLRARNGAGSAEKSVNAAPAPAPATAPAPAPAPAVPELAKPATPATPAAAAPVARNPALPLKSETWTYRMRGLWGNSPVRTLEFSLVEVAGQQLQVRLAQLGDGAGREIQRQNVVGTRAELLQWDTFGLEFAPFLGAYDALVADSRWSTIPTPQFDPTWRDWNSTGKVTGRERVNVPAGSFDTLKVELWSSRTASGSVAMRSAEPVRVHYFVWYAPETKRYVRMERKLISAAGSTLEADTFELVSHRKP